MDVVFLYIYGLYKLIKLKYFTKHLEITGINKGRYAVRPYVRRRITKGKLK